MIRSGAKAAQVHILGRRCGHQRHRGLLADAFLLFVATKHTGTPRLITIYKQCAWLVMEIGQVGRDLPAGKYPT